jgi:hypothetical protein
MALIQELDFIGIPSQEAEGARSVYRDVLGMRPDEHAEYEQWAGNTCFGVWEPEKVGMEFVAQTGNPLPLRVEDVHAARAELESTASRRASAGRARRARAIAGCGWR